MTVTPPAAARLAAMRRRRSVGALARSSRAARRTHGHRGRGEHVRQIAAADERRRQIDAPRGVDTRARAVDAAIDDASRARRRASMPNVTTRPRTRRARAIAVVVGVARRARDGVAPSRISAFASAIASTDAKEPEMRLADVRPHAHVRLGDAHQRADSPGVIHPSSTTAISGRCLSSMSDSGSPMWLLKFPRLRTRDTAPRETRSSLPSSWSCRRCR
jgi:hypothetical protein